MTAALILLYVVTLLYLSITERYRKYATIVSVQGWLLFVIALMRLHAIHPAELAFIALETAVFKAIIVPAILFGVIRRTKLYRVRMSGTSLFSSLVLSLIALIVSASITRYMADDTVDPIFFGVALYALLSGLTLIVQRTRLFSHLVGFLVIENGVFLFSTAIGVEMPWVINIAILLDILMSVLMMSVFFTRIDHKIHVDDADALSNVKD